MYFCLRLGIFTFLRKTNKQTKKKLVFFLNPRCSIFSLPFPFTSLWKLLITFMKSQLGKKTLHINCSTVCHYHCATKSFFLAKIIGWIWQKLPNVGVDQVWVFHSITYQDPKSQPSSILAVQQGIPVSLICATKASFNSAKQRFALVKLLLVSRRNNLAMEWVFFLSYRSQKLGWK